MILSSQARPTRWLWLRFPKPSLGLSRRPQIGNSQLYIFQVENPQLPRILDFIYVWFATHQPRFQVNLNCNTCRIKTTAVKLESLGQVWSAT
jgi:hypothetical protein